MDLVGLYIYVYNVMYYLTCNIFSSFEIRSSIWKATENVLK